MQKTKLFLLSFFMMSFAFTTVIAQDYPTSTGPAPYIERYEPISQVFTSLPDPNSRSLVYINSGLTAGQLNKTANMTSCALTAVGAPISYFPGAMARVSANRFFTVHQLSPYQLYAVDTLGNQVLKFNVTGVPGTLNSITGITWSQGQLIAIFTSCSQSQIGTIDTTTGTVTLIGSPTSTPACAISVNANPAGTLFAIDIASDNLYRVNRVTGVFTLVGALGVNA
ncbi:MAG: hypothetical protein N2510_08450, partial [Ignavibacteria bacterium]|nr:hypothetical protein [Ignavibacteria bacterium]